MNLTKSYDGEHDLSAEQVNALKTFFSMEKGQTMIIKAGPGSGKTFLLVEMAARLGWGVEVIALMFNKSAQLEMQDKLQEFEHASAYTANSFALRSLYSKGHDKKMNDLAKRLGQPQYLTKVDMILNAHFPSLPQDTKSGWIRAYIKRFIGYVLSRPIRPKEFSEYLARIDLEEFASTKLKIKRSSYPLTKIAQIAMDCLTFCVEDYKDYVDVSEQIYAVWYHGYLEDIGKQNKETIFLIDECQDTNALQALMYENLTNTKVFVGDPNQSLYLFRGAEASIFQRLWDTADVRATLTDCYRFGANLVEWFNRTFPHQKLTSVKEGGIIEVYSEEFNYRLHSHLLEPDTIVIDRYNAPIFKTYLTALEAGQRVSFNGRTSIKKELLDLLTSCSRGQNHPPDKLNRFVYGRLKKQKENAMKYGDNYRVKQIQDLRQVYSLLSQSSLLRTKDAHSIIDFIHTLPDALAEIDHSTTGVCTGHASKGLQWKKVVVDLKSYVESITDDGLTEDEREQEMNNLFVTLSRMTESLIVFNGDYLDDLHSISRD